MRGISSRSAGRRGLLAAAAAITLVATVTAPVDPAASRGLSCRSRAADRSLPYWDRQRATYFPYANERLHLLDRRRDDVVLADCAAVSNRPGLTYDSIHLMAKGGVLMARTARRAINAEARRQAHAVRAAQEPAPPASALPPPALVLTAPALRAEGIAIPLAGRGAAAGAVVELQRFVGAARWVTLKSATAGADGTVTLRYRPVRLSVTHRYRLRLASAGVVSQALTVRTRTITLAAFGDANFGDGVGAVMDRRGALYPWRGVAPTLRAADIAFGNLECSISDRGVAVPKEFQFRGRPERLAQVVRFAGLDVLNLANNHAGDYGPVALLDTVRSVRADGALPVGAGATLAAARRPQVISRLGLRVGFVGFSDIGPTSFAAGPNRPGTSFASLPAIVAGVRAARSVSDVVVATFHWGVERSTTENARQRAFARAALAAGATAVIAAHPHVLQPIRRAGAGNRALVAYSLGNFVWSSSSALTSRTGILRVQLSGRGVEAARLLPAVIEGTRPRLLGG